MRRLALNVVGCMALCAAVLVRTIEALIDWGLRVLPLDPQVFSFGSDLQPVPAFSTFADPRVDRHEAGASRRAAARHI